jgi:tetratricopeptide (TPR) repeat protein
MFTRLAVFVAPWTLRDAEAVCPDAALSAADVLPLVLRVVDRSLVARHGRNRFRLLDTVRSYAAERCDVETMAALRARHARHFLALSEDLGRYPADRRRLEDVEEAMADVDAAIDWALANDDVVALRFAGALGWMWATFHIAEGQRRLAQIMDHIPTGSPREVGRALQAIAYVESYMPTDRTKQQALKSITLLEQAGDVLGAARSRIITAFIEMMLAGDLGWASEITDHADRVAASIGDDWTRAFAALMRFRLHLHHGDLSTAIEHGRDTLSRFTALDDPWGVPWTSIWLAVALRTAGMVTEAKELLAPTVAALPLTSYPACIALQELGTAEALDGQLGRAHAAHMRAIEVAARSGVPVLLGFAHGAAGFGDRLQGSWGQAREHYTTALSLFREVAYEAGVASASCGLGLTLIDLGEAATAVRYLVTALRQALHLGRKDILIAAAEGLALRWASDQPRRAATLLGAASRIRASAGIQHTDLAVDERIRAGEEIRRHLPEEELVAALENGRRQSLRDLLTSAIAPESAAGAPR